MPSPREVSQKHPPPQNVCGRMVQPPPHTRLDFGFMFSAWTDMTLVASVIPKRARDRNFFIPFSFQRITIPFGTKELTLDPLMLSLGGVFPACSDLRLRFRKLLRAAGGNVLRVKKLVRFQSPGRPMRFSLPRGCVAADKVPARSGLKLPAGSRH